MTIVTKTENKRQISEKLNCKIATVYCALRFDSNSRQARHIRNVAMNEFHSYYIDLSANQVHLKCRK